MVYRPAVDVARLVSAALIVCFHAPGSPYPDVSISGLTYFILLTFCLQGLGEASGRPYPLRSRASRLLVPWLLWSSFYGLLKLVHALLKGRRFLPLVRDVPRHPTGLLIGPTIHLWFLPFAFLGGIAAHGLLRATSRLSATGALLLLGLVSASLAAAVPPTSGRLPEPFGQWMYALPMLPIGLAIGLSQRLSRRRLAGHYLAILTLTILIAWHCAAPSYLLGVLALAITILPTCRELERLRWLASLSMGIYLLHPAAFLAVHKYDPAAPWYLFASFGLFGSAVSSAVVSSIPRLGILAFGTAHRPHLATERPRVAATAC